METQDAVRKTTGMGMISDVTQAWHLKPHCCEPLGSWSLKEMQTWTESGFRGKKKEKIPNIGEMHLREEIEI